MIVRILAEGQFDVSDDAMPRLNQLDSAVEDAVETDDVAAFESALAALLEGVRSIGVPHATDALDESDLILPPADATLDEVRQMLNDDGLIPG
jgi:hypothetical protein